MRISIVLIALSFFSLTASAGHKKENQSAQDIVFSNYWGTGTQAMRQTVFEFKLLAHLSLEILWSVSLPLRMKLPSVLDQPVG